MRARSLLLIALMMTAVAAGDACADGLPTAKSLSNGLAVEAARAAVDACAAHGFQIAASVVTREGATKAIVVGDGASPVATETSRRKAYTAATIGVSTAEFASFVRTLPGGALPPIDPDILALPGGLPIIVDGVVIGGIGVGGALDGKWQESCVATGLARIVDKLK